MKLLEIMGEVAGVVISEEKNTLLIRKAKIFHNNEKDELVLLPEAVYCDKKLFNDYWLKIKPTSLVSESLNCVNSRNLVREFLNMKID